MGCIFCNETPSKTNELSINPQRNYNNNYNYSPNEDEITVANLKHSRDELYFKRKELINSIEKTENEIRGKIRNNQKNSAKFAIQKKKLFDEYLQQLDQKYLIIARMIQEVDTALLDRSLVNVMKDTNKLLRDIKNSIDLNEMQDLMRNLQENQEEARKFNQLFKEYQVIDDKELDFELNEYEKQVFGSNFNSNIQASNRNIAQNNRYQNVDNNNVYMSQQKQEQKYNESYYAGKLQELL